MLMMFASLLTFAVTVILTLAAARALGLRPGSSNLNRLLLTGFALATALLLFRPDEEIEAGEDAAAYFNAAKVYLRTKTFHPSDPALAELAPEERPFFRYGDPTFMITKDHTLWARDESMDPVSVYFFPAYSLLLAAPMVLGMPYAAFWLSGLAAAASGMILSGLAVKLAGRTWAGWFAYALFLLHPAVAWNLRALRAEWPASLLILCGLALWLPGSPEPKIPRFRTGLASGLSLGLAVLFHMTAIYVVFPGLVAGALLTRRDPFWRGWWTGLLAGLTLLAAQTVWLTDPYSILNNLFSPGRGGWILAGAAGFSGVLLLTRQGLCRFRLHPCVPAGMGLLMSAAALTAVFFSIRYRSEHGHLPFLPAWSAAYISLTDFEGVYRVMSRPWLFLALLGWPVICLRSSLGRWLFFLLVPASLTIGWVFNFMFETRRMVTFLVPLLILGTVCLLDGAGRILHRRLPLNGLTKTRVIRGLAACALLFLAGVSMRGRLPLYTTWNLQGLHGFYRTLSNEVSQEADFLFAEYTQTAVPIAHRTGLPLLPVNWDYRTETEIHQAAGIWRERVEANPGRRHVLISPFAGTVIPGLALEPLGSASVQTTTLGRARRDVPRQVNRWTRTLHLSRVLPPGGTAAPTAYIRDFRGSRLGAKGLANPMGPRTLALQGVPLGQDVYFSAPANQTMTYILAYPAGHGGALPRVSGGGVRSTPLGDQWMLVQVARTPEHPVRFESGPAAFLVQQFRLEGDAFLPVPLEQRVEAFQMKPVDSQWMRAEAALALPRHPGEAWMWVFATHGREPGVLSTLRLTDPAGEDIGQVDLTYEWAWHPIRLSGTSDSRGESEWVFFQTEPPFDPGLRHFPSDLGFRVHRLAVLPAEALE